MDAALHAIEGRTDRDDVVPSTFGDFSLGAPEPVSSRIAVETPGWTPYCVDVAARRALFVELAPDVDLSDAVFVARAAVARGAARAGGAVRGAGGTGGGM